MFLKLLSVYFLLQTCYGRVNKTCAKDSDCPTNAICQSGRVCFCKEGYIDEIKEKLRCLREATVYNDHCELDIQCTGLLGLRAHCQHYVNNTIGQCECNSDSHYKENICHPKSYIGDKCNVSSDCLISSQDMNVYCFERKCVCPPMHIPSKNRKECLLIAGLGDRCGSAICSVNNSKCEEYCTCKMGYVASKDNKRCLSAANKINDACEEDSQCIEFLKLSKCNLETKKCDCQEFAHRLEEQCWLSLELNSLCDYDAQCSNNGDSSSVECSAGFCKCRKGFSQDKNFCISVFSVPGSGSKIDAKKHLQILTLILFITNIKSLLH